MESIIQKYFREKRQCPFSHFSLSHHADVWDIKKILGFDGSTWHEELYNLARKPVDFEIKMMPPEPPVSIYFDFHPDQT